MSPSTSSGHLASIMPTKESMSPSSRTHRAESTMVRSSSSWRSEDGATRWARRTACSNTSLSSAKLSAADPVSSSAGCLSSNASRHCTYSAARRHGGNEASCWMRADPWRYRSPTQATATRMRPMRIFPQTVDLSFSITGRARLLPHEIWWLAQVRLSFSIPYASVTQAVVEGQGLRADRDEAAGHHYSTAERRQHGNFPATGEQRQRPAPEAERLNRRAAPVPPGCRNRRGESPSR